MIGLLLGMSPYYSIVFLILPFIVDIKYVKLCVAYSLLMAIDQCGNSYIIREWSEWFFQTKVLIDSLWLFATFLLVKDKIKYYLYLVISISLLLNTYLSFDDTNLLYVYWNEINFLLFEGVIAILLSTNKTYIRLSTSLVKILKIKPSNTKVEKRINGKV
jgi:hypothetical protein